MNLLGRGHLAIIIGLLACGGKAVTPLTTVGGERERPDIVFQENKPGVRTIHVMVALCDNKYQGIVPVPKSIGNGQDPASNLYWGCDLGLKTYFKKKTSDWNLVLSQKTGKDTILERMVFRHKTENVYLLADAYNGKYIRQATEDLLKGLAGQLTSPLLVGNDTLWFGSAARLLAYIGHDGLMDFELPYPVKSDTIKRESIILACASKQFFTHYLRQTKANPLLWTTNLMCPEAYTLHDALREWIGGKSPEEIRTAAAIAYSKYQKCSLRAARNLLVSGY